MKVFVTSGRDRDRDRDRDVPCPHRRIQVEVFWVVTPCCGGIHRFEGLFCLHLHGEIAEFKTCEQNDFGQINSGKGK
jgi:hypothetical protein